jgi:ferredoxin
MKRKNCRVIIEEGDEVIPETPEKIKFIFEQLILNCFFIPLL